MIGAVGLDEAGRGAAPCLGVEAGEPLGQLPVREPERGLVEGGRADVDAEQRG